MANKDIPAKIRLMYENASGDSREKWLQEAQKNENFFLGDQLTKRQRESYQQAGMPDFVVNKITPAVLLYIFFATAQDPRFKAIPREDSDKKIAQIYEGLISYCWDISEGQQKLGEIVQETLKMGTAYFMIDVDPDRDNGMGEVIIDTIDGDEVFVDANTRDPRYKDAEFIGIRKVMTKKKLKAMLPDFKKKIEKAASYDTTLDRYDEDFTEFDYTKKRIEEHFRGFENRELAEYFEVYEKIKQPYVNIFYIKALSEEQKYKLQMQADKLISDFQRRVSWQMEKRLLQLEQIYKQGGMIESEYNYKVDKIQEQAQLQVKQFEQLQMKRLKKELGKIETILMPEREWKEYQKTFPEFVEQVIEPIRFYKNRIKVTQVVGDKLIDEYYFDERVQDYPIVPVHYIHSKSPYGMGYVSMLRGKQKEINKAHQVALHNANLATALRWLYKIGSIDEDEWKEYSSSAGALLGYRGETPPTPVTLGNISNGFIQLTQDSKRDFDDLSGMYPAMGGEPQGERQNYKSLMAQSEFGTRRIKQWIKNQLEPALEHLGEVFKQVSQATYTAHKVFRVVKPNHKTFSNQSEITWDKYEFNKRIYGATGELEGIKWNYNESQFDVKIISGATMPDERHQKMEFYRWAFEVGLIDDIAFHKVADIDGSDEILERISQMKKLRQQIEEYEEQIKNMESDNTNLKRQLAQMQIRGVVENAELEKKAEILDTKAKQKSFKQTLSKEAVMAKREMQREMATAVKDFKRELEAIKDEIKNKMIENNRRN